MSKLEEYNKRLKLIIETNIDPLLDREDVPRSDRVKYHNFVREMCKTPNIDDLINEYVRKWNARREILEEIAKKRNSICNALGPEEDMQHKALKMLRKKYVKP